MKVFISWSGEIAKAVGEALCRKLPLLIDNCEPWISTAHIPPGSNWGDVLLQELEASQAGILCLAGGRINSPWLFFEAGALSSSKSKQKVIPYLIDLQPRDLPGPLENMQSVSASKHGTFQLVEYLAQLENSKEGLDSVLEKFDVWWSDLEQDILAAKSIGDPDNINFTGQWRYKCTVNSSPHDEWGGKCQIKKLQGVDDSQWQIQGVRDWKHSLEVNEQSNKKELLVPLHWRTDWFTVIDSNVVKFTYQIATPEGVIRGFSTGYLENQNGRATQFTGDFFQFAPVQPVFGTMLFELENA